MQDGVVPTPEAKISFVTLAYLAKGGDGWFPLAQGQLEVQPAILSGTPITEQASLIAYLQAQQGAKQWQDGARYVDPDPRSPESFHRIRELNNEVSLSGPSIPQSCRPKTPAQ